MYDQHDVFICYSRRNSRFVNRLAADLTEHMLDVWLDTAEIQVGDLPHQSIERGIETSRYFCFVISDASLQSYYAHRIEFETAFAKMVRDRREDFILPIIWRHPQEEMPLRLAARQYLDFSRSHSYTDNVRKLAKKINIHNESLTGERWYKAFEISPLGQITGISPLSQAAATGGSVHIFYDDGVVCLIEIYLNGKLVNYKRFTFDELGRVHENLMYERIDDSTEWRYIDTWRYYYDSVSGRRVRKVIDKPGARSRREIYYDGHNRATEERIVTLDGPPDKSYGYSRKCFVYSPIGDVVETLCFDIQDNRIPCP